MLPFLCFPATFIVVLPRSRSLFLRYATRILPRIFPSLRLAESELIWEWKLAARTIAARVALACVRERIIEGQYNHFELVFHHPTTIRLPLVRLGAFELHTPELIEARHPFLEDPLQLWQALLPYCGFSISNSAHIMHELEDSAFNLAIARIFSLLRSRLSTSSLTLCSYIQSEQCVVEGHPWHPMCKTRLGLSPRENILYAPETLGRGPVSAVDVDCNFVSMHGNFQEINQTLFPTQQRDFIRIPVHELQLRRLPRLFPKHWGEVIRPAPITPQQGSSLLSLRTIAFENSFAYHMKLAVDVHTTSARRQVSPMSVANGPMLSRLLELIQARDPQTRQTLRILSEPASAGLTPKAVGQTLAGQLGVIFREDPMRHRNELLRFAPEHSQSNLYSQENLENNLWVCAALGERPPGFQHPLIVEVANSYEGSPQQRGWAMLHDYIKQLIPPLLRLLVVYGIALEAHLQNTLVVLSSRGIRGFLIRDLGGIRIHSTRLRKSGMSTSFAPESFIVSDDLSEVQMKLIHTLFHAHLEAVFRWTESSLHVPAHEAWAWTRELVEGLFTEWSKDPILQTACHEDRSILFAPKQRAKALFKMRILEQSSQYEYTEVANAL